MVVPTAVSDTGKKPRTRLMISIKMSPPRSKNTRPPNFPGNPILPRAVIIKCCQWADMRNLIYQLGRRGYRFPCFPSPMSDVKEWPGSQLEGIVRDCCFFSPPCLMFAGVCSQQRTSSWGWGEIFAWKHFVETNVALTWNWEPSDPLRGGWCVCFTRYSFCTTARFNSCRSVVVTFKPLRNQTSYEEWYLEYWKHIK